MDLEVICNLYFYSRYIGHYQYYQPILLLKDPKLIKQICVKDFEHFLDQRPFTNEDADPLWNKNLFALKGNQKQHLKFFFIKNYKTEY